MLRNFGRLTQIVYVKHCRGAAGTSGRLRLKRKKVDVWPKLIADCDTLRIEDINN
jgi:hypothetical protein